MANWFQTTEASQEVRRRRTPVHKSGKLRRHADHADRRAGCRRYRRPSSNGLALRTGTVRARCGHANVTRRIWVGGAGARCCRRAATPCGFRGKPRSHRERHRTRRLGEHRWRLPSRLSGSFRRFARSADRRGASSSHNDHRFRTKRSVRCLRAPALDASARSPTSRRASCPARARAGMGTRRGRNPRSGIRKPN